MHDTTTHFLMQHRGGMNIFTHGQQSQDTMHHLKGDHSWSQTKKKKIQGHSDVALNNINEIKWQVTGNSIKKNNVIFLPYCGGTRFYQWGIDWMLQWNAFAVISCD